MMRYDSRNANDFWWPKAFRNWRLTIVHARVSHPDSTYLVGREMAAS